MMLGTAHVVNIVFRTNLPTDVKIRTEITEISTLAGYQLDVVVTMYEIINLKIRLFILRLSSIRKRRSQAIA